MNLGNAGPPVGGAQLFASSREDLMAYDVLPRPVRDALKDAPVDFSAQETLELVHRFGLDRALRIMQDSFAGVATELAVKT